MKNLRVVVEKAADGFFSAYSENIEGLFGAGETVEKAKNSLLQSIEISKEFENPPKIIKSNYKIEWIYDTQSFLKYWKTYLTFAGMERVTGIRAKQLQHYSTGLKKPRKPQREKIINGFNELGKQLQTIELIDSTK